MSVITPNMSLIESTIGVDSGLSWEQNLNASLNVLDGHNHSPGSGVQIDSDGINLSTDLPFNGNDATLVRSVRFLPQSAVIPGSAPDVGCLYEVDVDLYYNDGSGNQIRLTNAGSIAGTTGSISGLVAPASVVYVPLSETFIFQSDINTPANLDVGAIILRDVLANSKGITLSPPAALALDYAITYPKGTPTAGSVQNTSASGSSAWAYNYDAIVGSSAQVTGGTATHSTLSAALLAVPANGRILVNQGAWTENITISSTVTIIGSGTNSVFTGNISFVSATDGRLEGIRWTGSLTLDTNSTRNYVNDCFMAAGQTATDNGTNFVGIIWQG